MVRIKFAIRCKIPTPIQKLLGNITRAHENEINNKGQLLPGNRFESALDHRQNKQRLSLNG